MNAWCALSLVFLNKFTDICLIHSQFAQCSPERKTKQTFQQNNFATQCTQTLQAIGYVNFTG